MHDSDLFVRVPVYDDRMIAYAIARASIATKLYNYYVEISKDSATPIILAFQSEENFIAPPCISGIALEFEYPYVEIRLRTEIVPILDAVMPPMYHYDELAAAPYEPPLSNIILQRLKRKISNVRKQIFKKR